MVLSCPGHTYAYNILNEIKPPSFSTLITSSNLASRLKPTFDSSSIKGDDWQLVVVGYNTISAPFLVVISRSRTDYSDFHLILRKLL